jgi:hypothetical protein
MIYGPKADGTYLVEFRTAAGEALTISVAGALIILATAISVVYWVGR